MSKSVRKKSPRAPSMPLNEALSRAIGVYEKEQRHPAPTDVVAQDLGYKSANNGAALAAIASLKGFGLLEKPEMGKLAVSADVQSFHYAPDENLKNDLLKKWLRSPPVFAQLLDRYDGGLPSDATIRYDLIQQGFKPRSAESILKAFKESVEFADYYASSRSDAANTLEPDADIDQDSYVEQPSQQAPVSVSAVQGDGDRIPVRLDKSRRAWLDIPTPFYEADKERIKAQIDLLLTDDEDDAEND